MFDATSVDDRHKTKAHVAQALFNQGSVEKMGKFWKFASTVGFLSWVKKRDADA